MPLNGFTSADIHAPTYFFLTAAVGKVVRAVGVTDDLLIAGRLVGALWLTLGMLAMVALARAWGAGWVVPVLTAVAMAASPLLVSVSGYLSPDALGLLVGAGVLLAVTQWQRGRLPVAVLLLVAVRPPSSRCRSCWLRCSARYCCSWPAWPGTARGAAPWPAPAILVGGAGAGAVLWQQARRSSRSGSRPAPGRADPLAFSNFAKYIGYYLEVIPDEQWCAHSCVDRLRRWLSCHWHGC